MNTCMASAEKKNTDFIVGSRPEPWPPMMTGCGCCVRHQRMAPKTSGTSTKAKIPNSELSRALRSGSSTSVRSNKYETYSSHSTNVDVSRASHVHQMPHTGCAQIGPVISTTVVNAKPTSAPDTPSQSYFCCRFHT